MHTLRYTGGRSTRYCLHNADVQRRVPKLWCPAGDPWIVQVGGIDGIEYVKWLLIHSASIANVAILPAPKAQQRRLCHARQTV